MQLKQDQMIQSYLHLFYEGDFHAQVEKYRAFTSPGLGVLIADVKGNIGYIASGIVPIRAGNPYRFGFIKDSSNDWVAVG